MDSTISAKVETFFSKYAVRRYKKNQILVHAGDTPQQIFYLQSGKVKQYVLSYRGDEMVLNVFKPLAFFPLSYAINKTSNDCFFEAETDIELRQAPAEEVLTFIKDNPDVLYDVLARVYRGVDGLLGRIAHLMTGTAKSRVMYELMIECQRFGKPAENGYTLELSEGDIAARAGLSRETVSRELQKLRGEELVNPTERHIIVPSLQRLQEAIDKAL